MNEKTKDLREKRNILTSNITQYSSDNNLSNATVQISDGRIKFTNTRVPELLTFKFVIEFLIKHIKKSHKFDSSFINVLFSDVLYVEEHEV